MATAGILFPDWLMILEVAFLAVAIIATLYEMGPWTTVLSHSGVVQLGVVQIHMKSDGRSCSSGVHCALPYIKIHFCCH